MIKSAILSTESVNRYGFRVLTSGIDFQAFLQNPVMLYNHNRSNSKNRIENLPIGRWENLRVENNKLLADPVFDKEDSFAKKIKSKWDQGILNALSIGIDAVKVVEDEKHKQNGQTGGTWVKSELFEASIVDIPANRDAVKLSFKEGDRIQLSFIAGQPFSLSNDEKNNLSKNNKNMNFKEKVAIALGFDRTATESEIFTTLQKEIKTVYEESPLPTDNKRTEIELKAEQLIEKALLSGVIDIQCKEAYHTFACIHFDEAERVLHKLSAGTISNHRF